MKADYLIMPGTWKLISLESADTVLGQFAPLRMGNEFLLYVLRSDAVLIILTMLLSLK